MPKQSEKPREPYLLKDGTKVPSVTTIIGSQCGWGKEALMYWAWDQGRNGKDYRKVREEAAEEGKLAHACAEYILRGKNIPKNTLAQVSKSDNVTRFLEALLDWTNGYQFEVTHSEERLVSEASRFGGTIDAAFLSEKRTIFDLKTSASVRDTHLLQLAGYGVVWNEIFPWDKVERYDLLLVGSDASFHHHSYPSLDEEAQAFLSLRDLYEMEKKIKAKRKRG